MIQLTIYDSFGNECSLDDIIVIHNPEERIKYFGVLRFEDWGFFLSDMSGGRNELPPIHWQKIERICAIHEALHMAKELGKVEVYDVKEFDKLLNPLQQ